MPAGVRGVIAASTCMHHRRQRAAAELGARFETHAAAKEQLFDDIEVFYNQQRRHWVLDYASPAQFERAARSVQSAA